MIAWLVCLSVISIVLVAMYCKNFIGVLGVLLSIPFGVCADPALARLGLSIDSLKQQVAALQGLLEEIKHETQETREATERNSFLIQDIKKQLDTLRASTESHKENPGQNALKKTPTDGKEEKACSAQDGETPLKDASQKDPSLEDNKTEAYASPHPSLPLSPESDWTTMAPEDVYNKARGYVLSSDYQKAEQALNFFLKTHADHSLAEAARYWLGEVYFAQKSFKEALAIFAEGYQLAPKGSKALSNLYKIAVCFQKLNQIEEACMTLKQFDDAYAGYDVAGKKTHVDILEKKTNLLKTLSCSSS